MCYVHVMGELCDLLDIPGEVNFRRLYGEIANRRAFDEEMKLDVVFLDKFLRQYGMGLDYFHSRIMDEEQIRQTLNTTFLEVHVRVVLKFE